MVGKINRIAPKIIGTLDPDKGVTSKYCDNLRRLVPLYGETSVIAASPGTFTERALDCSGFILVGLAAGGFLGGFGGFGGWPSSIGVTDPGCGPLPRPNNLLTSVTGLSSISLMIAPLANVKPGSLLS